jgi:hypothetical protein
MLDPGMIASMERLTERQRPIRSAVTALRFYGVPTDDGDLTMALKRTRDPGRQGLEAAVALYRLIPEPAWPHLLPAIWSVRPCRLAWIYALCVSWRRCSIPVMKAAGSRERLVKWFRYADYDAPTLPFFRANIGTRDELPAELQLYRGGCIAPEMLAGGICWTPHAPMAARYALRRWEQAHRVGDPVVIRSVVGREAVLWRWLGADDEILVGSVTSWSIESGDVDTIVVMERDADALWQAAEAKRLSLIADLEADPDPWAG